VCRVQLLRVVGVRDASSRRDPPSAARCPPSAACCPLPPPTAAATDRCTPHAARRRFRLAAFKVVGSRRGRSPRPPALTVQRGSFPSQVEAAQKVGWQGVLALTPIREEPRRRASGAQPAISQGTYVGLMAAHSRVVCRIERTFQASTTYNELPYNCPCPQIGQLDVDVAQVLRVLYW
jgi:hypothetical protein